MKQKKKNGEKEEAFLENNHSIKKENFLISKK